MDVPYLVKLGKQESAKMHLASAKACWPASCVQSPDLHH